MGDTKKEILDGVDFAESLFERLFRLIGRLKNKGVPNDVAAQRVLDHVDPDKPNDPEFHGNH